MLRLGLCCIFREAPIKFRATTAKHLLGMERSAQLAHVSTLCLANSRSLMDALRHVKANDIGAFRILSPFFPRYTHPEVGYGLEDLPDAAHIRGLLQEVRAFRDRHDIRLSFHPDQFIVLSSPRQDVVDLATRELEYQAELGERVGAEVINIHGGGQYGDKGAALDRLRARVDGLSDRVRCRLTLENDDVSYTVEDLVPVCRDLDLPLVYDVHHHRCLPDGMSEAEATEHCLHLWQRCGREPYFHLSSPRNGWQEGSPRPHADYIDIRDFPDLWRELDATVDVEAKAKELAIQQLQKELKRKTRKGSRHGAADRRG